MFASCQKIEIAVELIVLNFLNPGQEKICQAVIYICDTKAQNPRTVPRCSG